MVSAMRRSASLGVALWCLGCAHAPRIDPELQTWLCGKWFVAEPFKTPPGTATPGRDDEIVLRSGKTWGHEPLYQVTIKGDGRVILVVTEGPLVGLEDYTVPPAVAAHLFSEFDALGFATRPFVLTYDFYTCTSVWTLSQRVGDKVTSVEQSGRVMVKADGERLHHLILLVETVARVGEHAALCAPLDAAPPRAHQ